MLHGLIDILETAKLLVEGSPNLEYNRGICELIARLYANGEDAGSLALRVANILDVEINPPKPRTKP